MSVRKLGENKYIVDYYPAVGAKASGKRKQYMAQNQKPGNLKLMCGWNMLLV